MEVIGRFLADAVLQLVVVAIAHRVHLPFFDISGKSKFAGKKLRELGDLGDDFLLLLTKDSNGVTAMPNGDTVLDAGSHVVLIARSGDTGLLARICGK